MPRRRQVTSFWSFVVFVLMLSVAPAMAAQQSDASRKALTAAAEKGSAPAQYALGAGAQSGGNLADALKWFRMSAENGYAPAQLKLGEMYQEGAGVDRDETQAREWYEKAAAGGLQEAAVHLAALGTAPQSPAGAAPAQQPAEATDTTTPMNSTPQHTPIPQVAAPAPPVQTVTPDLPGEPSKTKERDDFNAFFGRLIVPYVVVVGIAIWFLVRPRVVAWYRSGTYFIQGRSAGDLLLSQMTLRLQVEGIALTISLTTAVVSFLVLATAWGWWSGIFK